MADSVQPHRWKPTRLPHPWDSPGKNTGVGCHFLLQCRKVKSESEVAQSCPTLSDPMDCSLPGSAVHEIFQARVLEWGAIAFSGSLAYGSPISVITWPSSLCVSLSLPSPLFSLIKTLVLGFRVQIKPVCLHLNQLYLRRFCFRKGHILKFWVDVSWGKGRYSTWCSLLLPFYFIIFLRPFRLHRVQHGHSNLLGKGNSQFRRRSSTEHKEFAQLGLDGISTCSWLCSFAQTHKFIGPHMLHILFFSFLYIPKFFFFYF